MDILNVILNFILQEQVYLPVIYILIGYISFKIAKKLIISLFSARKVKGRHNKRYKTLMQVTIDTTKVIIVVFVILAIFTVFGFNVSSFLAGLGIASVLVGLAFQDLFKDVIVGIAIILEDYFAVGDTIEVNNFRGEVLHIGIKSTKIKSYDGSVLIISNRNIDSVINYSTCNSLAMVEIPVAYESDIEYVEEVLDKLFKKLNKKIDNLKGEIEIWGIEELGDSAVKIKVAVLTEPYKHFPVQREIRKEVKKEFDRLGIKIPYNQVEIHNGQ